MTNESSASSDLEKFFTLYGQAVWEKDVAALMALYSEDLVIFDLWEKPAHSSYSEWSETMNQWLGSLDGERVRVEFEKVRTFASGNQGYASAFVSFSAVSEESGKVLRSIKERISLGFIKEGSIWRVNHQHTSLPISPSNREAIFFK